MKYGKESPVRLLESKVAAEKYVVVIVIVIHLARTDTHFTVWVAPLN